MWVWISSCVGELLVSLLGEPRFIWRERESSTLQVTQVNRF
jgi:hypothetical protein